MQRGPGSLQHGGRRDVLVQAMAQARQGRTKIKLGDVVQVRAPPDEQLPPTRLCGANKPGLKLHAAALSQVQGVVERDGRSGRSPRTNPRNARTHAPTRAPSLPTHRGVPALRQLRGGVPRSKRLLAVKQRRRARRRALSRA